MYTLLYNAKPFVGGDAFFIATATGKYLQPLEKAPRFLFLFF